MADTAIKIDTIMLPVSPEELRLIKIGLFELNEYLGSPLLSQLRQRVQSLTGTKTKTAIPEDSIFNALEKFAKGRHVFTLDPNPKGAGR